MTTLELSQSPADAISRVIFPPGENSNLLLVSSWDHCVRLYDTELNTVRGVHQHDHAVLDCCFLGDRSRAASGGLARDLRHYDFHREQDFLIGKHSEAVRCVQFAKETGLVFSGSWDKTVGAWDVRTKNMCHRLNIENKVFGMSCTDSSAPYGKIVVADSAKKIHIYDLRRLEKAEEIRENVLKYQIRCLSTFANGCGFAAGSAEGKVAYEYFNPVTNTTRSTAVDHPVGQAEAKSYAFRCHREKLQAGDPLLAEHPELVPGQGDKIFPVNAIAFHPKFNTFATGGGDGSVCVWDGVSKKRLWRQTKPFITSVSSLAFSPDGKKLAIAVSYDFSKGAAQDPRITNFAQITVKEMGEADIKPKGK